MHPANTTQWLAQIDDVIASGPFDATWESLKAYEIPKWYEDDKFGIFIHWGVYCVPAFANEWYARNMYQEGTREFEHHVKTYGPHDQFGYKDFIPMFKAENFDPVAWAELFRDAGAKFVVPVAEHHDGFAMYDSELSEWCAAKMGPKRDVAGDLAKAVRDLGMVYGASSHRAEHFWFFDGGRKFPSDVQDPANDGLYGPAAPAAVDWHDRLQAPPTDEFMQDWLARTCEIVDKYQPQIVWFDWWIQTRVFKPYLQKFAAFYYNRAAQWGKGVAINYKYNAFEEGTAVFDVERGQLSAIRPQLWQNDTSVSKNSWCYIEGHEYKEVGSLVEDLVDVVSKNGALLLNIGPKPDGTIPEHEQQMLRSIGAWLKVNGEAIYGTRPWKTFGEGPTEVPEGAFTDTNRAAFTAQDIRFTTKGNDLYAIALAWPGETLTIKSLANGSELAPAQIGSVTLLGNDGALAWTRDAEGLKVTMPAEKPCDFAYVVKIGGAAG
jgi:alpha-L-fucosidase